MKRLRQVIDALFFPDICPHCKGRIYESGRRGVCVFCTLNLPYTNQFSQVNNLFEQRFWGRIPIESGASLLFFEKQSLVQSIIYELKYGQGDKLAYEFGVELGIALFESGRFEDVKQIVPVPLHKRKLTERGYNQSLKICEGIAEVWDKPVVTLIKRIRYTESQTKMSKIQRLNNLRGAFELDTTFSVESNILIVDDVLTTGTTIEACANCILKSHKKTKISACTLAFADLW